MNATTRIRVADPDRRQDLGRYLTITATNGTRSPRRMIISTAGTGARQFLVSYVGEAAVWKTTYRLVFPSAGDRGPLLQGWAVVDNVSAADWTDVELSLVAGAPQAFRQALSLPLFVARPTVALGTGTALVPETHGAGLVTGTARVTGVARDASGAALPGVSVELLDGERAVANGVTDGNGRFSIGGVAAGAYTLQATLPGFTTARLEAVPLDPSRITQRDVQLTVGALTESITVTASQPRRSNAVSPRTRLRRRRGWWHRRRNRRRRRGRRRRRPAAVAGGHRTGGARPGRGRQRRRSRRAVRIQAVRSRHHPPQSIGAGAHPSVAGHRRTRQPLERPVWACARGGRCG